MTAETRSGASRRSSNLLIANHGSAEVKMAWIDFEGKPQPRGRIRPGSFTLEDTYTDHLWLITDLENRPLAIFRADGGICRAVLGESGKIPDSEEKGPKGQ